MRRAGLSLAVLALAACAQSGGESVPGDSDDTRPYSEIAEDDVVVALGTEPFWNARIDGETLVWKTPENIDGTSSAVDRFAGRGGVSFSGELRGESLDLAITPGKCNDGMSDRTYPFTATIRIGARQLNGCAHREGDDLGPPP